MAAGTGLATTAPSCLGTPGILLEFGEWQPVLSVGLGCSTRESISCLNTGTGVFCNPVTANSTIHAAPRMILFSLLKATSLQFHRNHSVPKRSWFGGQGGVRVTTGCGRCLWEVSLPWQSFAAGWSLRFPQNPSMAPCPPCW